MDSAAAFLKKIEKSILGFFEPVETVHAYAKPSITPAKRSWDFVPPEVVRPVATIVIGDVAIIARRLGMDWKQFDPLEGSLKAEGNGQTITSATVRSMGTVLQVTIQEHIQTRCLKLGTDLYIPDMNADGMGFWHRARR